MAKKRLTGATFDASAQTIVQSSFSDVTLAGIQLIVNVTDQIIIYNFADSTKGGTLATDTLTLEYDTTTMSDTDELMILVEDGLQETVTAELSATDNAVLDAIALSVSNIDTDTTTLIGHVDGIETLVTSTNTKLDTVIGHVDGIEALLTTIDADTGSILLAVDGIEALLTTIDGRVDGLETSNSAIQTSVQLIDDAVYTDDTSTHATGTSKGIAMMAVANPTDAAIDANDFGVPAMTLARALKNDITSIAGTAAAVGSGNATGALRVELPTNGTGVIATVSNVATIGTSVVPGTSATHLGKARDSAIGATDTGVAMLGVRRDTPTAETPAAGDYVVPQFSANGEAWVRSIGEVADDAGVTLGTQRGMMNAGVAVQTDGTDPSAVSAEADAAIFRTDMQRILLVNSTHPRGTTVSADYASAQTNVSVIAAPGASLSIYITDIQLSNGATAGNVTLLDGSGGAVKWEAYPAVNGGAVLSGLRQPIRLTANTALCLTSTTVTTHSIFIGYYIAP